jgi:redox-sensitive bicupin YhaK (pirin superfamily)
MSRPRSVTRVVDAQQTSEGAGVRLRRSIGTRALDSLDPFLLLDEFKSDRADDYMAGFPDHPHRGFETVTYMLAGSMLHQDHKGNRGNLVAGSVQWMTAGKGIIHSEMPQQKDGLMWGFQLWVNLPAREKLREPRYQDIPPERIREATRPDGTRIRVIAGEADGVRGAVSGIATDPLYLDVALPPSARFQHPIPADKNAFVYVFEGEAAFGVSADEGGRSLHPGQLGVLGDGDTLEVRSGDSPVRFLLLAARPIGEPVARYGPFVMNTRAEIHQAIQDLEDGTFLG